ncbi:hypothetical protein V6N13_046411 [Hibiscus sabdariffa]
MDEWYGAKGVGGFGDMGRFRALLVEWFGVSRGSGFGVSWGNSLWYHGESGIGQVVEQFGVLGLSDLGSNGDRVLGGQRGWWYGVLGRNGLGSHWERGFE